MKATYEEEVREYTSIFPHNLHRDLDLDRFAIWYEDKLDKRVCKWKLVRGDSSSEVSWKRISFYETECGTAFSCDDVRFHDTSGTYRCPDCGSRIVEEK